MAAAHCWHGTPFVVADDPAQHPEICCHCGTTRTRTVRTEVEPDHGPYAPSPVMIEVTTYVGGEGPCPPGKTKKATAAA